jgi:hypothetical protein
MDATRNGRVINNENLFIVVKIYVLINQFHTDSSSWITSEVMLVSPPRE